MRSQVACGVATLALLVSSPAFGQMAAQSGRASIASSPKRKVPANVILVKGAWSSADDSVTPLPEGATLNNNIFRDQYFGITYPLPPGWIEKYTGPPPSDSGRYVLAQIWRPDSYKGEARGNILIVAQDIFFTRVPADNALEVVDYTRDHLQTDYKLESEPSESWLDGRAFASLAYWSPAAELHWYVLATDIRCHAVEFVFMNRDSKTLDSLVGQASRMKLPTDASPLGSNGRNGDPVCIKDYASDSNVVERIDPVFSEQRSNPIPVRIIIDKQGKVKHIHFLSAFPDQAKAISDALKQWKFKPYVQNGQSVEVETGIMFGRAPHALPATLRADLEPQSAHNVP
jgi:hypothetical protein